MRDVVLLTIDCWRHDALDRMPRLRSLTEGYGRSACICQAPATRGAFPAILSGLYYPQAYDGFDSVRPDVTSLPAVLSESGYATGAFAGSNPFLSTWADDFDAFWNDEMRSEGDGGLRERARAARSRLREASSYLRLRSRVTATDVARRARDWYEDAEGPRFCWMHLMDVHAPFLPGLRRARQEGLVDAYRSHLRFMRDPESATEADLEALERLYWRSVEALDEQLERVLEFVDDDALVVVLGDHGEEFRHDGYGHARLYDETVKVPLLASEPLADRVDDQRTVRQLDVPASVLDAVGCEPPEGWEGAPIDGEERTAFMLNHSPQFGRTYAGIRTERYKLVRTSDAETGRQVRTEAYDLREDPGETVDVYGEREAVAGLERELDRFLERDDIRGNILEHDTEGASPMVEDRLAALGYK